MILNNNNFINRLFCVSSFLFYLYPCVGQFLQGAIFFNELQLKTALEINVTFTTSRDFYPNEAIIVQLPKFSRRFANDKSFSADPSPFDIPFGDLMISPSIDYLGGWHEGQYRVMDGQLNSSNFNNTPFAGSYLTLMKARGGIIPSGTTVSIAVYKHNGIGAYCGFPGAVEFNNSAVSYRRYERIRLRLATNLTVNPMLGISEANITSRYVDDYLGIGKGCREWKFCNGHGACNYCFEKCHCFDRYGSENDTITLGRDMDPGCSASKLMIQ